MLGWVSTDAHFIWMSCSVRCCVAGRDCAACCVFVILRLLLLFRCFVVCVCVCVWEYLPSVSVCRLVYNLLEGETGTHVLNWLTAAGEPRLLSTDNTRRCNICGVYFCHLVVIFSLCPAQRPLWDFNHPAAAAAARIKCPAFPLWVWHFVPIFMFICVFSSFPSPP